MNPLEALWRVRYLRNWKPDIVHTFGHRPSVSWPARFLKRWAGAPLVQDWADLWGSGGIAEERSWIGRRSIGKFDNGSERSFRTEADFLMVATTHLEKLAVSWGVPIHKVRRLPPGSNSDLIRPQPRAQAKRTLGIPADAQVLVYSGLSKFDLQYVAAVYSHIVEANSEVVLLLIGGQRLPETLRELNGRGVGTVLPLGAVEYEDIGDLLASGDLMLLPLSNRGFNLARFPSRVGDYLAAGRPVVTHRTGDVGEFVSQEGTGIVVDDSPRAMASAIVEILRNEAEMSAMGARARNLAEGPWSWDRVTDQIEDCYSLALSASMVDSDPVDSDQKKKP